MEGEQSRAVGEGVDVGSAVERDSAWVRVLLDKMVVVEQDHCLMQQRGEAPGR